MDSMTYSFINSFLSFATIVLLSLGALCVIWGTVRSRASRGDQGGRWRGKQMIVGGLILGSLAILSFMLWASLPYPPFGSGPIVP